MLHGLTVWAPLNGTLETPISKLNSFMDMNYNHFYQKPNAEIYGSGHSTDGVPGYRFLDEGPIGPVLSLNEDVVRPDSPSDYASSYYLICDGTKSWGNYHSGACWIKITDPTWGSRVTSVSLGGERDSSGYRGFWFYLTNRGRLGFKILYYLNNNSGYTSESVSTPENTILDYEWYHVAYTFNNKTVSLYVNGEKVLTETLNQPYTPTGSGASFGCEAVTGRTSGTGYIYSGYFRGQVCDWRMYTRVLSDLEIKELANPMIAHYPMRDEVGHSNILPDCTWLAKKHHLTNSKSRAPSRHTTYSRVGSGRFSMIPPEGGYINSEDSAIFKGISGLERTVCGWYTLENTTKNNVLLHLETPDGNFSIYTLNGSSLRLCTEGVNSSNNTTFWYYDIPNSETKMGSRQSVSYHIFRHLAIVRDMEKYIFYIDGEEVWTLSPSKPNETTFSGKCYLGYGQVDSLETWTSWKGDMSDFRFYRKALSKKEIAEIANNGVDFCPETEDCCASEFLEIGSGATTAFVYIKATLYGRFEEYSNEEGELAVDPNSATITAKNFIER